MISKKQFEKLAGIKLTEKDGKLYYDGSISLDFITDKEIEIPDNLNTINLVLTGSNIKKLPKGLNVKHSLCISATGIDIIPEDAVFGTLYVNRMYKPISFEKEIIKVKKFCCYGTRIKKAPKEIYTDFFEFNKAYFEEFPNKIKVKNSFIGIGSNLNFFPKETQIIYGNVNIKGTKIQQLNDDSVFYNSLNISDTKITNIIDSNLIVGSFLYLEDDINLEPDNYAKLDKVCSDVIIDDSLYWEIKNKLPEHSELFIENYPNIRTIVFKPNYKGAHLFENKTGKYIKADGIFSKIIEQKGNVYHVQLDEDKGITYLVTDGEGNWSHGNFLKEAKDDLIYKIGARNKDDYNNLNLESELSFEEAIKCYRVITGACSFGTKNYIDKKLKNSMKKDKYMIQEIIEITEGEYGNEKFKNFFL